LKGSNRDEARYNAFATGRFEVAKNRELRGEERAMVVPEGKSNGSENHHSRDGSWARAMAEKGWKKIWSWRINSEDEDEPSNPPHRQRCLRTGSTVPGWDFYCRYFRIVLSYWALLARCHAPPMSLVGPQQGRECC
jgi:hypothetical protein